MPSPSTLALRLIARLPLPVLHAVGAALGTLLWWIPNKHRRLALAHLECCLPELDRPARRRIARDSLRHMGRMLAESPRLWFGPAARVRDLVRESRGEALVRDSLARGHAVILVTPHLGAWEMAGLYCSGLHPLTSLYKPQKGPADELIRAGRERFGAQLVPSDGGGVKRLLQALRRGDMIGVLPDQDPPRGGGVFAPFFGITAHTSSLVSRLAARTGALIVFTYAERLPHARGYRMHFHPAPAEVDADDRITAATALNRGVEELVRRLPEQYWWSYRRFRRRPKGEPSFY